MRVLCLTSWYPPHHFGGYETSCHDVMSRLTERGHHVEVLTSDHRHRGVDDGAVTSAAAVHRDLQLYFRDGRLWSPPLRQRLAVERHNQRALARALEEVQPDVVAVWHVGAMSLGLLTTLVRRGLPLVYAVSDDWPAYVLQLDAWSRFTSRSRWLARAAELVTRVPSRRPDLDTSGTFCFISQLTRERCRRSSPWSFPRSTVVYSGFDGRLFGPPGPGAAVQDPSDPPAPGHLRLLYVGRIDERKGLRTVVRAVGLIPGASLVIDGRAEPVDLELLRAWTDEVGVTDRVHVQTSERAALADVYRAADVCVFASEWEEPFGLVPLEGMACGTPVAATGVGGSAEFLVDGENCVLFTPGDPSSLAAAAQRLHSEVALRDRVVANGLRTAQHFDIEHLADAFEAWYRTAADPTAGPPPPERRPPVL